MSLISKINSFTVDLSFSLGSFHEKTGLVQCGESSSPPLMWPGFDSLSRRQKRVQFVGSELCSERFFPGSSGFHLSRKKPTFDLIYCDLV